jgi:carboxylate-amine ligase
MSARDAPTEPPPTAATLRTAFETEREETVGLEEEVFVLDPETFDLVPRAADVLARLKGDGRFKAELPRAQLEIVTGPAGSVPDAAEQLAAGRRRAAEAAEGIARFAACGAHPFAAAEGELGDSARYEHTKQRFGTIARRQLVGGLHVHVALNGPDRALAAYNGMREHLPLLAALAACAPFHAGADTGLASVRPHISGMLPRQGVPPAFSSWEAYASALEWLVRSGAALTPRAWWWELRLHPFLGTLEVRVPDAQATIAESVAVASLAHCLIVATAERHDAGEAPAPADSWRITENRWSACRYGLAGELADPRTGEREPTRERLERTLAELAPLAGRLGCAAGLGAARELAADPAPERHREIAAERGAEGLAAALAERFCG